MPLAELAPPFSGAPREAVAHVLDRFEATALLACGSILRGEGDAASDLDLYVLHRAPFRQRLQRYFGGVPTEVFVNPWWLDSESKLDERDTPLAVLARRFFATPTLGARLEAAAEIADPVLGTPGFYAWESERLPSPAPRSD